MNEEKKGPVRISEEYEDIKNKMMEASASEIRILTGELKEAFEAGDHKNIALYSEVLASIKQKAVGHATSIVNASRMSLVSSGLSALMKGFVPSPEEPGQESEEAAGRSLKELRKKIVGGAVGGKRPQPEPKKEEGPDRE